MQWYVLENGCVPVINAKLVARIVCYNLIILSSLSGLPELCCFGKEELLLTKYCMETNDLFIHFANISFFVLNESLNQLKYKFLLLET